MVDLELNWSEIYADVVEYIIPDLSDPKGKPGRTTTFVEADHEHDLEIRRSVTGVRMFFNKTPIQWYSRLQNTVQTSTYRSDLVAIRITMELTRHVPVLDQNFCNDPGSEFFRSTVHF